MPTATPPIMGRKVAAVAVLDVSSVSSSTSAATAKMSRIMGREDSPFAFSPIHSDRPVEVNMADRDRPPPKSSSTSHGISFAVSQSSSRLPLAAPGTMNMSRPAIMPTMASSYGKSQPKLLRPSGMKIQASAATRKMRPTAICGKVQAPSFFSSSLISSLPPGIRSISGANTVTSTHHATNVNTTATGMPTSIHSPKPMVIPCASSM